MKIIVIIKKNEKIGENKITKKNTLATHYGLPFIFILKKGCMVIIKK
jgi:hypothetical protein